MTSIELSTGSIASVIAGIDYDKPVLQILGSKKISGNEGNDRYRLLVSDGKSLYSFAMLATQLNDLYSKGDLAEFTIIRVDRYITSMVNKSEKGERIVIIILELTILKPGNAVGKRIGNPVAHNGENNNVVPTISKVTNVPSKNENVTVPKPSTMPNMNYSSNNESLSTGLTYPIASLSPYQNKWVIKVRVVSKSPIRTWSNAKGEGKLFNMDLMDESGEIRATAFREACDKYYDMIEIDKVYFISKGQLKPANKQYSTLNNDYEITFTNDTVLQLCQDDENEIPKINYNFVKIEDISEKKPEETVDVIGICQNIGDLVVFTSKTNNREFKKREIRLIDNSNVAIELVLWGEDAVNFEGHIEPVVLVKNARIKEFGGGKTLSIASGSVFKINPDIPEGHKLRGWYDNGGGSNISKSISTKVSGTTFATNYLTFYECQANNLGNGDKPDYFQTKGIINIIRSTNAVYKACPQQDCNKKVIDEMNGQYRCEKCNANYPNFKYRLLLNMSIGDWTSNKWATCFTELAEKLLGKSSQEIGQALEENSENAEELFSPVNFKSFIFKLRIKAEMYGDMNRSKITMVEATPVNHKEYNKHMITTLQGLTGIGKK